MFDLFRSREKSVRILLGALLLVVALSMLTYLVPNYGSGGTTNDTVVASVGGQEITALDVQALVQRTMRGRELPPELVATYIPQLIDGLINERAMAYEAQRLGFRVSDDDLRRAIMEQAPSLFPDGKFIGKDTYAAMLAQQGMTIEQFETNLRRQILITRLREVAAEGNIVTEAEIVASYKEKIERGRVQYVKLTSDKYKAEAQPTVDELRNFFQVNGARYQQPEKKNLVILIADQTKIADGLHPTDDQLQQMYNKNKEQFRTPERVHALHILFMTQGKPPADDAKIRAQAEDVLKQAKAGADFSALATKYSEDTSSKVKGGDVGWVQRGQMVAEFEKATFDGQPGSISGLVKTQYGYHIIKVLAHEQAHLQTFEEVKAQLTAAWKKAVATNMMQEISDRAQPALAKDPGNPDKIADEFKMQVVHADGVEPGKPLPEIGTSTDFDQSLTGLTLGKVSQPVLLPGNKLAFAEVTAVIPPQPAKFEDVEDQIRGTMAQNRLTAAVQKHARDLANAAKANGGDLEKAAKAEGLEVKETPDFERDGTIPGIGSASYLLEAFKDAPGTIIGPLQLPDGTIVAKVGPRTEPDASGLAEKHNTIRDELKGEKARQRDQLFEVGVREELQKEGKLKLHQDVIDRMIQRYRAS